MTDWKAHAIAQHAAKVSELGFAQSDYRLADPSRFNRAMAELRALIDEYLGHEREG